MGFAGRRAALETTYRKLVREGVEVDMLSSEGPAERQGLMDSQGGLGLKGVKDEVLISRVAGSGDGRALSELYDRYSGLVYSAGVRYLGDRTHAEDLVQDVFL